MPPNCPEFRAGLRPEDRIVAVNGRTFTRGWEELSRLIVLSRGEVTLDVRRDGRTEEIRYLPAPNPELEGLGFPFRAAIIKGVS